MGQERADALHLMIEAKKLAFSDRDRHLADRDYMKVSVTGFVFARAAGNVTQANPTGPSQ
jgi:gamma-glutamyltranspeptidase